MTGKNLRLLGQEDSPGRQPDIYEMIRDLEVELSKGESVYLPAELAKLDRKLDEYQEMLRTLNNP